MARSRLFFGLAVPRCQGPGGLPAGDEPEGLLLARVRFRVAVLEHGAATFVRFGRKSAVRKVRLIEVTFVRK